MNLGSDPNFQIIAHSAGGVIFMCLWGITFAIVYSKWVSHKYEQQKHNQENTQPTEGYKPPEKPVSMTIGNNYAHQRSSATAKNAEQSKSTTDNVQPQRPRKRGKHAMPKPESQP